MSESPYKPLIEALQKRQISSYFQNPDHLVVSRQRGPAAPFPGNSFSVCHDTDAWYLWTWAPHVYRVPQFENLADLCVEFVDRGESAQVEVPADLVERYRLVELTLDEWIEQSD